MRRTYTVEEAAKVLGVGKNQAYDAVKTGQIPSIRIGKRILVPKDAFDRLVGEPVAGAPMQAAPSVSEAGGKAPLPKRILTDSERHRFESAQEDMILAERLYKSAAEMTPEFDARQGRCGPRTRRAQMTRSLFDYWVSFRQFYIFLAIGFDIADRKAIADFVGLTAPTISWEFRLEVRRQSVRVQSYATISDHEWAKSVAAIRGWDSKSATSALTEIPA